jgi:MFS family permease
VRPIQADFEWKRAGIMASFTIMLTTMGLSSPFVGRAADRLGPKKVIITGAGILGLGFFIGLNFIQYWLSWAYDGPNNIIHVLREITIIDSGIIFIERSDQWPMKL